MDILGTYYDHKLTDLFEYSDICQQGTYVTKPRVLSRSSRTCYGKRLDTPVVFVTTSGVNAWVTRRNRAKKFHGWSGISVRSVLVLRIFILPDDFDCKKICRRSILWQHNRDLKDLNLNGGCIVCFRHTLVFLCNTVMTCSSSLMQKNIRYQRP